MSLLILKITSAIIAAISINNNNLNSKNNKSYAAIYDDEYGGDNRSVSSRISSHSHSNNYHHSHTIQQYESNNFISTFILFYQLSLLGLLLFCIYVIDNYPFFGAARSSIEPISYLSSNYYNLEFDEDQFVFWILVLVVYGYVVSWQRNDGKPIGDYRKTENIAAESPSVAKSKSSQAKRKITGRRQRHRKHNVDASLTSKSSTSDNDNNNSDNNDINTRLDDVLLDDGEEEASFETILDTIESDVLTHKSGVHKTLSTWPERVSKFFGLHYLNEKSIGGSNTVVVDVKPEEDVFNRYQTLEMKGFLSAALLIYQYNNEGIHSTSWNIKAVDGEENNSRTNMYENLSNVAMSSFVFLAGYVHTYYFYYHPSNSLHDTYRISRILTILCRYNLLAIFLSFLSGKIDYMACGIITYCFILVYMTMSFHRTINYDKYPFRLKLLGLAFLIFIIWDCDVTNVMSSSSSSMQSSTFLRPIYEWYCLAHKHHWAVFLGMVFAINQPIASYQLRKLESLHLLIEIAAKVIILLALGIAVVIWASGPLHSSTIAYNISHTYFGIIPILAYIYLRNICSVMREHQIGMLCWLGKYSLEIYLLHYHAFTDSGCVIFIPGYPRCNFLLVTLLLLMAARYMNQLTIILLRMLLPKDDDGKCTQHVLFAALSISIACVLAILLDWTGMVNMGTLCTIAIVCGILIYQSLMDKMWEDYDESDNLRPDITLSTMTTAKASAPLIGMVVFLLSCGAWTILTRVDSTVLPCGLTANEGHWIPVNPCLSRGRAHRQFHATDYLTPDECESKTTLQWSWDANSQHKNCRYHYHNDMEVQQHLQGKRIILIGDSTVRSVYHAICRFVGDINAGNEGTTPQHSDARKIFGSTTIEYKWAPLTNDIVTKLKTLKNVATTKHPPDLVIAGGGAWDKLHLSVTDEDLKSQQGTIAKLVISLREVSMPTVWFTPPTINTKALNSDDKRAHMGEVQMAEARQMYAELGVTSSVSFVLDGPSFTAERVSESFDGIHYPASIYDAGAQILFNAFDLLLTPTPSTAILHSHLPKPGSLGNPYLGLMMLCVALIGLFFFDGYLGVSYLAQAFVMNDTVSPGELYDDAFASILRRLKITVQEKERAQDEYYDSSDDRHEMTELLGRSSSSLSRRRDLGRSSH